MFNEYGYMEEGKLGKPYNIRLLKRLAGYAIPYKKTIAIVLFLTILTTLFDLAVPYLSKIAIDRYILSCWYSVETDELTNAEAQDFFSRYGHLLEKSTDGSLYAISYLDIKKIDPVDLYPYRTRGIISSEKFYKTERIPEAKIAVEKLREPAREMADGSILVPHKVVNSLTADDIMRIRASALVSSSVSTLYQQDSM